MTPSGVIYRYPSEHSDLYQVYGSRELLADAMRVAGIAAKAEILTALREPQRKLATLIHNRAAQLRADEAELDAIEAEYATAAFDGWGEF